MQNLLHNCHIWTDDGYQTWMLLEDNKIVDIGKGNPPECEVKTNMNGNYIFPGLIDSHIHVFSLGRELNRLGLNKPGSISEMQNILDDYVKENQQLDWIIGRNWDQDYMEDGRYPNKEDIDLIVSDKPVLLFRGCNHIGLLNTKALEILQVDSKTDNPYGGIIDKDENGEPTGILRENALSMVTEHIKIRDYEERKKLVKLGLKQCLEVGLTSVQTNDPDCWQIYKELDEAKELPLRVALTIYERELGLEKTPEPNSKIHLLSCDRVKLFADGSLGAQTAALREPYADTKEMGLPRFSQDELNKKVLKIKKSGFRIEVHAIGDLATENVLNAFEYAGIEPKERPVLTHGQILGEDLIERMKKLGVIANIQPQFVTTDSKWVEKRLGKGSERLKYSYAWKTLIDSNIPVAGGSDSPIEDPNPLYGIYAAIFRKDTTNKIWKPEERLSFKEAIDLYTKGGSYAAKWEKTLGQLKKGFLADFIVVNQDIYAYPEKIPETLIEEVWVDGIRRSSN
ncbi:MAG: amidohydrolase [Candidatus Kariarchaeaceae archaeon]|jgi:predicted amidohydrolase YtcJ